jgi:hypothetical protein
MIVKFKKPQQFNGTEIEELDLDFGPIKGKDIKELARTFSQLYKDYVPILTVDLRFQELVAARAANLNPMDLDQLDGDEYLEVLDQARNFLLRAG